MSDLAGVTFAALAALFSADTGVGGLNENSDTGTGKVRHFVRRGDPNYEVDRPGNWPMVVVDIHNVESRVFSKRRTEMIVRMHLYTQRDPNTSDMTIQNAVSSQITAVFDGAQLAAQTYRTTFTASFAMFNQLRDFQAPSSGTELHRVFEFSLTADIAAGV